MNEAAKSPRVYFKSFAQTIEIRVGLSLSLSLYLFLGVAPISQISILIHSSYLFEEFFECQSGK